MQARSAQTEATPAAVAAELMDLWRQILKGSTRSLYALLGELDQLVGWLAKQGDAVRVVIFQSAIPDFFLAHLDLGFDPGHRR